MTTTSYVLVIEDDAALRNLLARLLARKAIEVHTAESIAVAHEVLERLGCPRLSIIDVVLPDGDGVSLLKKISESCPKSKAILVSGFPPDELKEQGFTFAVTYVPKPFDNRDLLAAVEAALQ